MCSIEVDFLPEKESQVPPILVCIWNESENMVRPELEWVQPFEFPFCVLNCNSTGVTAHMMLARVIYGVRRGHGVMNIFIFLMTLT